MRSRNSYPPPDVTPSTWPTPVSPAPLYRNGYGPPSSVDPRRRRRRNLGRVYK